MTASSNRPKRRKTKTHSPRAKRPQAKVLGVQVLRPRHVRTKALSIVPQPPLNATPHDNEIMGSPRVVAIYWGTPFGSSDGGKTSLATNLDNFFRTFFLTSYMTLLQEYGVGSGTFVGSIWLPHDPSTSQKLSADDMLAKLGGWLDSGFLPQTPSASETNLMFAIFAPPEVTLSCPGNVGCCAYHYAGLYQKLLGKNNLFFAALAFPGTGNSLTALTKAASHELVEAFTNRSAGRGWFDDTSGEEIGDACSWCGSPGLFDRACPYPLNSYWRQSTGRCLREADVGIPLDVNRNGDGRLELFAAVLAGLWHAWQTAPGTDNWSSGNLNTPPGVQTLASGPTTCANQDLRLEAFVVGGDGQLWHIFQNGPSGWSAWGALGAPAPGIRSLPSVFQNQNGQLEVFVVANDGALWHTSQTVPNQQNDSWSGWTSLGTLSGITLLSEPAVSMNFDGRLEVFVTGGDDQVWHKWQTSPGATTWSSWASFYLAPPSQVVESPVVTRNSSEQLQLFAFDGAGPIWSLWQSSPSNGWMSGWLELSAPQVGLFLGPALAKDNNGLLEVFVVGFDGALYFNQETSSAGNQGWSGWNSLGNPQNPPNPAVSVAGTPVASLDGNGNIQVFVIDNFGVLWHISQTSPGSWSNSKWEQLPQQPPTALGNMSVTVTLLQKTARTATIRVKVSDLSSGSPIGGATVTVFDSGGRATVSGVTANDGTVQLTYRKCIDPETKTPMECDGAVTRAGYQDTSFVTPFPV